MALGLGTPNAEWQEVASGKFLAHISDLDEFHREVFTEHGNLDMDSKVLDGLHGL